MTVARPPRSWARLLRLLPAAALAIGLAARGEATKSAPDDHAAVCRCGMSCRPGACCCVARKPAPREEPEPDAPDAASDAEADRACGRSGPCLGAMPCGDDVAAPVKTARLGAGEAWAGRLVHRTPMAGGRVPPPSSDDASTTDASRLDRPPKADPAA